MTLQELIAEVFVLTSRPDLEAETRSAVKAATLKLHHSDFYPKDLKEEALIFSAPASLVQIEYATLFPDWRALSYLRPTDADYSDTAKPLTILTPDQTLDDYQVNRENVAYLSGQLLQLRMYPEVQHILVGYYAHPNITNDNFNSWIAREYPYAIVYEAAAKVMKKIGLDEQSGQVARDAAELILEMRNSNILAKGE